MPDFSYPDIVFKSLEAYDDVSSFHSTEPELDDFLHDDALLKPDKPAIRYFSCLLECRNCGILHFGQRQHRCRSSS